MESGVIRTLFTGVERDEALFPRTKTKAVSDDNGVGLDALLDEMNYNISNKAPAGYGLGTEVTPLHHKSVNDISGSGFYFGYNGLPDLFGNSFIIHLDFGRYCKQLAYSLRDTAGYANLVVMREMNKGTWGEWEWVNPPMVFGEEYRTTEHWSGKPVYCKLVSGGYLPNTGTKSYKVAENATVISVDGSNIRSVNFGGSIPPTLQTDNVISCFVNGDSVYISCGGDRSNIDFYFIAKYTKTTD